MEKIKVVGERETKKLHNTQILREKYWEVDGYGYERKKKKKKKEKEWGKERSYLESEDGEQRERERRSQNWRAE